jgi:hypothetical protein
MPVPAALPDAGAFYVTRSPGTIGRCVRLGYKPKKVLLIPTLVTPDGSMLAMQPEG